MELRPILSALLRQKTRAILIATQIALSLAIISNGLFIVDERLELMTRDLGVDVPDLLYVSSTDLRHDVDYFDAVDSDLRLLRNLPGVLAVTPIGQSPFGTGGNMECFSAEDDPDAPSVCHNRNKVDEEGLETLGVRLIQGRNFRPDEIEREASNDRGFARTAIVTQDLADAYFPDGDAVGRDVYSDGDAVTIVGVVEHMSGPWVHHESRDRVMLQPIIRERDTARLLVRAEPGGRDRLMPEIEEALLGAVQDRLVRIRTQQELVDRSYQSERATVRILFVVIALLVLVNAVGIIGLASSSVSQRTRQIGTRRALGARRRDILRYFLVESSIVAAVGVAAGCVLSVAFNAWLIREFSMQRLEVEWVVVTLVGIVILTLLATLPPARRATRVPPSVATRSV